MLYDGFLSFAHATANALDAGDRSRASESGRQALSVVHELMAALDQDANPELAGSLFSLYEFVDYSMQQATRNADAKSVRNAVKIMVELRDAWAEASQQLRAKAA